MYVVHDALWVHSCWRGTLISKPVFSHKSNWKNSFQGSRLCNNSVKWIKYVKLFLSFMYLWPQVLCTYLFAGQSTIFDAESPSSPAFSMDDLVLLPKIKLKKVISIFMFYSRRSAIWQKKIHFSFVVRGAFGLWTGP